MKVKLDFKQIVDIANTNLLFTGVDYESAKGHYPTFIILEAEPVDEHQCITGNLGRCILCGNY